MDENMKLIMAEFVKVNTRLDQIETRLSGLETKVANVETRLDKLQDNYERLDVSMREMSSEVAAGFYKSKHQMKKLEAQGAVVAKILEYRELLPVH